MTIRSRLSLLLFFIFGLIVLFFLLIANFSFPVFGQSFKDIFLGKEKLAPSSDVSFSSGVSVKSFPVNGHWLWVIEMKGDNNSFDPDSLIVNEGDVVDIRLAAMDRDYEVYLPGLGIYKLISKGEKSEIQFQAYPAGEHFFSCRNDCSNHPRASLVINR